MKLPYFNFYVMDFAADGLVEAMSTQEVGAYILLLCKAWHEDPAGSVPDDDRTLARWARMAPEEWQTVKERVLAPWRLDGGRWHQKRMQEEHKARADAYESFSDRGRRGGLARSSAIALLKPSLSSASAEADLEQDRASHDHGKMNSDPAKRSDDVTKQPNGGQYRSSAKAQLKPSYSQAQAGFKQSESESDIKERNIKERNRGASKQENSAPTGVWDRPIEQPKRKGGIW